MPLSSQQNTYRFMVFLADSETSSLMEVAAQLYWIDMHVNIVQYGFMYIQAATMPVGMFAHLFTQQ